ncbi:DUF1461 domain-containing protein [Candidatus Woesearchaeota archaeon]|nr:DUF1461 domain-containing protein [Candidatus Woesearchaeota archaeon]
MPDKDVSRKRRLETEIIVVVLIVFLAPLTIYLFSVNQYLFDYDHYVQHFRENNIYDDVPHANETISQLLEYFRSGQSVEPEIEGFNERERSHLLDVKLLIHKGSLLLMTLLAVKVLLFVYLIKSSRDVGRHVSWVFIGSGLATLAFSALLMLGQFPSVFSAFHSMFFERGTWLFSRTDLLIRLFPFRFFHETAARIIVNSITLSVFLVLIGSALFMIRRKGVFMLKQRRKKKQS